MTQLLNFERNVCFFVFYCAEKMQLVSPSFLVLQFSVRDCKGSLTLCE